MEGYFHNLPCEELKSHIEINMSFLFFQDNTSEQTLCADYYYKTRIVILYHPAD